MSNPAPAKMKAYRRTPLGTRPVAELVEIPFPAHSEVLLKILAGGVCHSDCSILGPTSAVSLAFPLESKSVTLGHEGAGVYFLAQLWSRLLIQIGHCQESSYLWAHPYLPHTRN